MTTKLTKKLTKIVQALGEDGLKLNFPQGNEFRNNFNNLTATTYSWIYEKLLSDLTNVIDDPGISTQSIRIFTNDEMELIGLKNCNYLLNLFNLGLLNNYDIDTIIEEIKIYNKESISKNDINILILALFLGVNNLTLPGSRLSLYLSDPVN